MRSAIGSLAISSLASSESVKCRRSGMHHDRSHCPLQDGTGAAPRLVGRGEDDLARLERPSVIRPRPVHSTKKVSNVVVGDNGHCLKAMLAAGHRVTKDG